MAFRAIDPLDGQSVADDSPLARGPVQLGRNLEAIAADRPLLCGVAFRAAQRWHAPWPVAHGPIIAGYTEAPLASMVVHLSVNGRVASAGESNPADGVLNVYLHATAWSLDQGVEPPPTNLADWGATISTTARTTHELTVAPGGRRGWVGAVVWVRSVISGTASHNLTIDSVDVARGLFCTPVPPFVATLANVALERAAVTRPAYSNSKAPDEGAGPVYWAEYSSDDVDQPVSGTANLIMLSPPPPDLWSNLYTDDSEIDLYPMGVALVESVLVEATPVYEGPPAEIFAPAQPARGEEGPKAAAEWLTARWAGHWRALSGLCGCERGAGPWGDRLTMPATPSYQALPGDGVLWPGLGPAPVRFRALVGIVGKYRHESSTAERVTPTDVRLVVETAPPGVAAEAEGVDPDISTELPTPPLAMMPGNGWQPLRQALDGLDRWGAWSSRGTLWPRSAPGVTVADLEQITWVECEVVSAAGEHPRVVRPEIKADTSAYVWWVAGAIAWRYEAEEGEVYVPDYGGWQWSQTNDDTRPADIMGVQVVPGANDTMGSYAEILSDLEEDCYLLRIVVNNGDVTAEARPILIDIDYDPAGGTTYTEPVVHDLNGCSASQMYYGGIAYEIPVSIPAGASVAARAQVGNATAGEVWVWATAYGRPADPRAARAGDTVTAYGVDDLNSRGTAITPGTTAEGAWVDLGAIGAEEPWAWLVSLSIDDATMGTNLIAVDLSLGTTGGERMVITNQFVHAIGSEQIEHEAITRYAESQQGDHVWVRCQYEGAADSNVTAIAYGVSGP